MTRVHHRKSSRNACPSKARRRQAPPLSSSPQSEADAGARPPVPPPIRDAIALCGLLLRTLGPDIVVEFLGRLVAHGADTIITVCRRAHQAAELARRAAAAEAARDVVASCRTRGRASRTTPRR